MGLKRQIRQLIAGFSLVTAAFILFYTFRSTKMITPLKRQFELGATEMSHHVQHQDAARKQEAHVIEKNIKTDKKAKLDTKSAEIPPKSKNKKNEKRQSSAGKGRQPDKGRQPKSNVQPMKDKLPTEENKPMKTDTEKTSQENDDSMVTQQTDLTIKNDEGKVKKKKYLIYLCDRRRSCGGWGDRQKGMMAAYVLANVTGRVFGINMSYPCDIKMFYVPKEVNWYVKYSEIRHLSWELVDWMDNRNKGVDCENDFNKKHPSDVVFLKSNQDIIMRIKKSPRYGHMVPAEFTNHKVAWSILWKKLMKPSIHLEEHVEMFMAKIPTRGDLICGHIRMRRSSTIPNDSRSISSIKNLKFMWDLLAKYEKNASRIFIATDSTEVRDIARRRFKELEIDTDGLVLHIDRQGKMNNACLAFEMALLEQAVLSKCKVLVMSPSGFSFRASLMSTVEQTLFTYINGTIRGW